MATRKKNEGHTFLFNNRGNYREIFNLTDQGFFLQDIRDGRIIDVNDATLAMFNCTYEDIINRATVRLKLREYRHTMMPRPIKTSCRRQRKGNTALNGIPARKPGVVLDRVASQTSHYWRRNPYPDSDQGYHPARKWRIKLSISETRFKNFVDTSADAYLLSHR